MTDNDKIDFFVETMKHARSMLFESDIVYFQEKQKDKEFHSHQGIIFLNAMYLLVFMSQFLLKLYFNMKY